VSANVSHAAEHDLPALYGSILPDTGLQSPTHRTVVAGKSMRVPASGNSRLTGHGNRELIDFWPNELGQFSAINGNFSLMRGLIC
jgi:hypothetical protein